VPRKRFPLLLGYFGLAGANSCPTRFARERGTVSERTSYCVASLRVNADGDRKTASKGIAAFERTLVSNNSPFDRWLRGDKQALTAQQVRGFRLFTDPAKGNCATCHQAPNFTDNGFHNIGLASYGRPNPDIGRFAIKPVAVLKGAFKTPTLRDIALTAPYFHDGSAKTLSEAVEQYNRGGVTKADLSPEIKPLNLSAQEIQDIAAFMQGLTTPAVSFMLPKLPPN
jgi:cytochrome c peroxidase